MAAPAGSPRIIGAGQTGGSIVVSASGKKPRTLLVDTWKKILRLQKEVKAEGWKASFTCPDCAQPIVMTVPSQTDPRLECDCTTWIGKSTAGPKNPRRAHGLRR